MIEDWRVQIPRKIVMYLSSYKLFERHSQEVLEALESPTLTLWLGEKAKYKLRWIAGALESLADGASDDNKELLNAVRSKVLRSCLDDSRNERGLE